MNIFTPDTLWPMQLQRFTDYHQLKQGGIARQLVKKSLQPHILEHCWEDSLRNGRFGSESLVQKWMSIGRFVYTMTENEELRGVSWFRDSPVEALDSEHRMTFGVRLYEGAVGRGLAMPFMRAVHLDLLRLRSGSGIWLSVRHNNERARELYERFGYRMHSSDAQRDYMVLDQLPVV